MEALASNTPVVYQQDDNRLWFIDDGGIPVQASDEETFSKRINTALYTEWKDKPRNQAQKFAFENTLKKYKEIFENRRK
jgi:glycosyltransferase involved in cell wall biosynthesis